MEAGIALKKIDVSYPVQLVGYEGRVAWNSIDDLYTRTLVLRSGKKDLVIVNCDLLYIPNDVYGGVREEFRDDILVLNATHNHSGPNPKEISLSEEIIECIREAKYGIREAKVFLGRTVCNLGVNRRRSIHSFRNIKRLRFGKTVEMRPDSGKTVDRRMYSMVVRVGSRTLAHLISLACHPCMWHGPSVSSDFVGRIQVDGVLFFLQGFAGDIDVDCRKRGRGLKEKLVRFIEGDNFKNWETTEEDLENAGRLISERIREVSHEELELDFTEQDVEVPLVFKNGSRWSMGMQFVRLGQNYAFLCVPGEIFNDYGLKANEIFDEEIIPLGYTNGSFGYLPSAKDLREGGYEVERAWKFYGLPGAYSEEIEAAILDGFRKLRAEARH